MLKLERKPPEQTALIECNLQVTKVVKKNRDGKVVNAAATKLNIAVPVIVPTPVQVLAEGRTTTRPTNHLGRV
jgi:hypothetical protein